MKRASVVSVLVFACAHCVAGEQPGPDWVTRNEANSLSRTSSVASRPPDGTPTSSPTITIWKVGSPNTDRVPGTKIPPDLQRSADRLGYDIGIQAFPAEDFVERLLTAFANNQEPDILALENFMVIRQLQATRGTYSSGAGSTSILQSMLEVTGSFDGLGQGWHFIFQTSRNYEAARSLALQFAGCRGSGEASQLTEELRPVIERIGRAYLEGPETIAEFNDPDRLQFDSTNDIRDAERPLARKESRQKTGDNDFPLSGLFKGDNADLSRVHVLEMGACDAWGNDHLAFASLFSTYEAKQMVGALHVMLVLRNQDGDWRLLAGSTDPISNTRFLSQVPKLAKLLQNPLNDGSKPAPALLVAPQEGKAPLAGPGERFGNFEWQPGESGNEVAYIVEFAYNDDARLFMRFTSDNSMTGQQISAGNLWMTLSVWRWRVWSISDTGAVAFSESRSFPN